ncbi:MAG: class I SAM-dependent methyltransferase [Armatimonadetes bacterium]|nr:class I SAM-dependent methyltransferase [Armatimonadota bacterium]
MSNAVRVSHTAPVTFDRVASEYERTRPLPDKIGESVARYIVSLLNKREWMLDAGCGTGRFTRPLARRHDRVVGADVSREMIARLREEHAPFREPLLVRADLRDLPFPDAQFSIVLTVHVLHLIAEWQTAFAEMWRVLEGDGCLLLGYEDRSVSAVRDFYLTEGRQRGLLPAAPGTRDTQGVLIPFAQEKFGVTQIEEVSLPAWRWKTTTPVSQLLTDLDARLYSSQWGIAGDAHEQLMERTRQNVRNIFGAGYETAHETITTRFVLVVLRKPDPDPATG